MAELINQTLKSLLAKLSPSSSLVIKDDSLQDLALSACGKCWKLFLDLDQCKQHYRQCKSTVGELHQTRVYLEILFDVKRDPDFEPDQTLHILKKESCNQQSVDLMNESIPIKSPVECNLQPSRSDNVNRTFEKTPHNGLVNQSITGVNESCTQNNSKSEDNKDKLNANLIEVNRVKTLSKDRVTGKLHNCSHCTYQSRSTSDLKKHIRTHTGEKPHKCPKCNSSFSRTDNLKEHMIRRHYDQLDKKFKAANQPLCCPVCNYKTLGSNHLNQHIRTHTGENPHKCTSCDHEFSSIYLLKEHMIKEHFDQLDAKSKSSVKSCSWPQCAYRTFQSSNLKHHIQSHTGEKPYNCDQCFKRFSQKSNLSSHIQKMHETMRMFKCEQCKQSFSSKAELWKHTKSRVHYKRILKICQQQEKKSSRRLLQ